MHEDCLQYARERLEHFKQDSAALEEFEFCEPAFVQGKVSEDLVVLNFIRKIFNKYISFVNKNVILFSRSDYSTGNCLRIESTKEYDAVYCGAAVPQNYIASVKRFVRIGGIIVVPYKGRLCCFTRVSESGWACKKVLGVSFATLVIPDPTDQSIISLREYKTVNRIFFKTVERV